MGSTHFLTRTLKRVSTEMSLHVLAYNLVGAEVNVLDNRRLAQPGLAQAAGTKRVIAILGVGPLMAAIRA